MRRNEDALLWIMLEYWDQYIELGLKQTKSQVEAVSRWKQTASVSSVFISDYLSFASTEGNSVKREAPVFDLHDVWKVFLDYKGIAKITEIITEEQFLSALRTTALLKNAMSLSGIIRQVKIRQRNVKQSQCSSRIQRTLVERLHLELRLAPVTDPMQLQLLHSIVLNNSSNALYKLYIFDSI